MAVMTKTTSESTENILARLTAACIDGRAHNIRYRQNQLHLLYGFLQQNATAISNAISGDSGYSDAETEIEYYLTMNAISSIFENLDFDKALEDEYLISNSKDNLNRRIPYGMVLIKPTIFCRFYSIIVSLAAALAAGNCVLLELEPTLLQVDAFIRKQFTFLDRDVFAITNERINDESVLSRFLVIDQVGSSQMRSLKSLISEPALPTLAIVDRTASVVEAANQLCTARFHFQGQSPYAPNIVLVNEFVKQDFVEACIRWMTNHTVSQSSSSKSRTKVKKADHDLPFPSEAINERFESNGKRLLEVRTRSSKLLSQKVSGQNLIILPITGLVDAVTVTSNLSTSLLGCYCFASPEAGKFLSQQVDSRIIFINQVPLHILVGPALPNTNSPPNPRLKYDTTMLSLPKPEQITPASPDLLVVSNILNQTNSKTQKSISLEELRAKATAPLKPIGQHPGTSMGFFDQGIITGVVAFVLPSLGLLGYAGYRLVRFGLGVYRAS